MLKFQSKCYLKSTCERNKDNLFFVRDSDYMIILAYIDTLITLQPKQIIFHSYFIGQ